MYVVYVLKSLKNGRFYIGSTSNLEKRLRYHNLGLNRSTRYNKPWILVYKENFLNKTEAIKREIFIKKQKSRKYIEKLINQSYATGRSSDG